MMKHGTAERNTRSMKIIPKPGKDSYTVINSYRPISLISLIKSYENVLYQRFVLSIKMTTKHSFDDFTGSNTAYQQGRSVHDAFNIMDDLMRQYENDG